MINMQYSALLDEIEEKKILDDAIKTKLNKVIEECASIFKAQK